MGPIIAVLLAITMAIFPISMPQAAAPADHHHGEMQSGHGHHDHAAKAGTWCDHGTATADAADDPDSHDAGGQNCCSMGACHALQVGTVPTVHSPALTAVPVAITGDEQVEDVISGRLDRPPRAV